MAEKETTSSLKMKTREETSDEEVVEKLADLKLCDKQEATVDSSLCAICQDTALHPVTLPCGHSFCYLCIKGVYARRGSCALCRQPIPAACITRPTVNDGQPSSNPPSTSATSADSTDQGFQWLYEARSGGWWQYEERISAEIERAYKQEETSAKVSISGFMYEVDFSRMVQYRVGRPERCRRVRREGGGDGDAEVRGVAGITFSHRTTVTREHNQADGDRHGQS